MRSFFRDRAANAQTVSFHFRLSLGITIVVAAGLASGCGSIPVDDRAQVRAEIDQQNSVRWNALFGTNWDINKHVFWSVAYDGFKGTRDAFISSLVYRW